MRNLGTHNVAGAGQGTENPLKMATLKGMYFNHLQSLFLGYVNQPYTVHSEQRIHPVIH